MNDSNRKNRIETTMSAQRSLILLLTNNEIKWMTGLLESYCDILTVDDFQQAAKMLSNIRCDLLIIDSATLKEQTFSAIREFKRNFPHRPVGVLWENADGSVDDLLSVGADLILDPKLSPDDLQRQIRIVLHQNAERRAIVTDVEKLHVVSSLPVLLKELTNTEQIYFQAIKIIINLLNLEAVRIVIGDGDIYRVHTIRKPFALNDQGVKSMIPNDRDDPMLWSMRHGMVQVYEDISLNPRFDLSDGLNVHSPTVIVPFSYPGNQNGALAFFLPQTTPVFSQDTFIYEQFSAQLDSILLRSFQNEMQARHLLMNKRLIEAWSTFAQPQDFEKVLELLMSNINSFSGIKTILISYLNSHTSEEYLVDNSDGKLIARLRKLELDQILEDFHFALEARSGAVIMDLQETNIRQFREVIEVFGTDHFVVIPIVASDERLGIIVLTMKGRFHLDDLDMRLLENITLVAVNALERITLRNIGLQNHKELMSILHSVREGIFYVDDMQKVTFCNPQFTELTSIAFANHLNQNIDGLLQALAMASHTPTQTYNQLQMAKRQLTVANDEQNYPIVNIMLWDQNIELSVEFVVINSNAEQITWMGVVHATEHAIEHSALEPSVEGVREAHTRLRNTIDTLTDNAGQHSYNEHSELLEALRINATIAGNRWDEFVDAYQLYTGAGVEQPQSTTLYDLLQRALADTRLIRETSQFKVHLPTTSVVVAVDSVRFVRALTSLLAYIIEALPFYIPIEIRTEEQPNSADIIISSAAISPFSTLIEVIAQPDDRMSEKRLNVDLVNALEIIRSSGTKISIQRSLDSTKALRIAIPLAIPKTQRIQENELQGISPGALSNAVMRRTSCSVLLVEGQSTLSKRLKNLLDTEEFNLQRFESGKDALLHIPAVSVDLIILDLYLEGENAFVVCREIRKQTEVPILVIADRVSNQERSRSIQAGADHLLTTSTSTKEIMDTVRTMANLESNLSGLDNIRLGDLYVDFASRAVFLKNALVELTRIEFDVLRTLIVHRGQTVTHEQLLTEVWGPGYESESQYLWVSISRLRKKLEFERDAPRYIRTQSGIGYYFAIPS